VLCDEVHLPAKKAERQRDGQYVEQAHRRNVARTWWTLNARAAMESGC
jgi:hypothetical protein